MLTYWPYDSQSVQYLLSGPLLLLCGLRLVAASEGYSLLVVPRLVTAVASRYRAWAPERGLSICGAQAALPLGIRDLPEPAIKLIS